MKRTLEADLTKRVTNLSSVASSVRSAVGQLFRQDLNADQGAPNEKSVLFHPRFAAGQAFTPDILGGILGHIFHFPLTVQLVEAFTMPARTHQTSFPWQVRCPREWRKRPFGDLLCAWLQQGDPQIPDCGPALCVAIYRERRQAGQSYNMTVPPRDEVLQESDSIMVFGTKDFGRTMMERGLLRGGEEGASSAEPRGGKAVRVAGDDAPGVEPHGSKKVCSL